MTLDDLKRLEAEGTMWPWVSEPDSVFVPEAHIDGCYCIRNIPTKDAALIAALRNAAPALLAFVDEYDRHNYGCACPYPHVCDSMIDNAREELTAALAKIEVSK